MQGFCVKSLRYGLLFVEHIVVWLKLKHYLPVHCLVKKFHQFLQFFPASISKLGSGPFGEICCCNLTTWTHDVVSKMHLLHNIQHCHKPVKSVFIVFTVNTHYMPYIKVTPYCIALKRRRTTCLEHTAVKYLTCSTW